jgi:hypothetical protein
MMLHNATRGWMSQINYTPKFSIENPFIRDLILLAAKYDILRMSFWNLCSLE